MQRIVCAFMLLVAGEAFAQDKYPSKPVRLVVPFPPGSASDFLARTVGQKLGEGYGQQVVIDNRPGAGGLVGSGIVATAAPDGYTITMIGQPHLVNTLIHKNPGYRPFDDFVSVTEVASMPNVLVVAPGLPVKTVADLIALAKAKPGQLNIGSAGIGSSSHLAGEMFKSVAGINVVHIPFRLLGDIFTEMLAGRVHLYVFPLPAAMPMIKQGKLQPFEIDQDTIKDYLTTREFPDPELMIRTSGEYRISNFLLYQLAYAELYFTNVRWPDFRKENLYEAIIDYQKRERRFGKTGEQVKTEEHTTQS